MFKPNIGELPTASSGSRWPQRSSVSSLLVGHPAFALIALIPMATAYVGVCPLYSVLGLHT